MGIGERIKQRRCELGMSQRDLADRMGYKNHSTIAQIENSTVDVPHSRIVQFSEVLSVSVEYLMGLDSTPSTAQPIDMKRVVPDSHYVFANNLRFYINKSGKTQSEIAGALGIPLMTLNDWTRGKTFPRIDKLQLLAQYFGVSKSELIEEQQITENEKQKVDSRNIFASNLRLFVAQAGKTRREVSDAIGVSYSTFSDWCNEKKYPRIEKLEALAKYFGVSVPELVGQQKDSIHQKESTQIGKDKVLDIILRLHTDAEFLEIVEKMNALDNEKLKALKQLLVAFGE